MKTLFTVFVLASAVSMTVGAEPTQATVQGYVIDSACLFIKNLDKPVGKDCAVKCAKAGSPLVILADDGTIYLPISGEMPAAGQNERLMNYAGERVIVRGQVFERGGAHAMVIEKIDAVPAAR